MADTATDSPVPLPPAATPRSRLARRLAWVVAGLLLLWGLTWLGLEPDEAPVFQFARADRHREVALDLLARGSAYRDYMTPDELAGHALPERSQLVSDAIKQYQQGIRLPLALIKSPVHSVSVAKTVL